MRQPIDPHRLAEVNQECRRPENVGCGEVAAYLDYAMTAEHLAIPSTASEATTLYRKLYPLING
jgi:hypothetical protein